MGFSGEDPSGFGGGEGASFNEKPSVVRKYNYNVRRNVCKYTNIAVLAPGGMLAVRGRGRGQIIQYPYSENGQGPLPPSPPSSSGQKKQNFSTKYTHTSII